MAPNGFWEIEGEPYTTAPGSQFRWFRSRIVGGRTNHWGRIALRFAPVDFKSRSTDGMGDDWPITYEELAPYYDKVESYIGVFGTKENISSAPDGIFLPPPKPRCTETIVKKACDKLNITCIPSRLAILTKPLNGRARLPLLRAVRPRLHDRLELQLQPGDDSAGAGDRTLHPDYQCDGARDRGRQETARPKPSPTSTRPRAREQRVYAQAFVVAASACESARLLLNSRSTLFPDGLANSSGVVGRYLTDSSAVPAADTSRSWRRCRRTITTASAACTCTCPGGSSSARTIFCAAITSSLAAAAACRGWASSTASATSTKATARRSSRSAADATAPSSASPAAAR